MATLATQVIRRSGLTPAYAAASAGGDNCTPGQRVFLHVKNGGGSPINVTIAAKAIPEPDMTETNLVVAVPNASERMIGPIDAPTFADPSNNGLAAITYSAVTSVTIGAFDETQP